MSGGGVSPSHAAVKSWGWAVPCRAVAGPCPSAQLFVGTLPTGLMGGC